MTPSSKKGQELKFQERWEFRRKDSECDSSSNDSKASGEFDLEKQKLVSSLVSVGDEETSNAPNLPQNSKDPVTEGDSQLRKSMKGRRGSRKKGKLVNKCMVNKSSVRKISRKKSKIRSYDPDSLNEIKVFMDSLLEELRITRERLIISMREEMQKIMTDNTIVSSKQTRRKRANEQAIIRVQNPNSFGLGAKLMEPTRREISYGQEIIRMKRQRKSKLGMKSGIKDTRREGNCGRDYGQMQHPNKSQSSIKPLKDDASLPPIRRESTHDQDTIEFQRHNSEPGFKTQKSGGLLESSVKRKGKVVFEKDAKDGVEKDPIVSNEKVYGLPIETKFSLSSSDQSASSMYLTLPSVVPESSIKSHGIGTSSLSHSQSVTTVNQKTVIKEKKSLMFEAGSQGRYLSSMQQEQLCSLSQDGSRNVGYFGQYGAPTSGTGTEFPMLLHQGLDRYLSTPNQVGLQKMPQQNSIAGLEMNVGPLQFSSGNQTLSQNYVANNLQGHLSYKSNDTFMPSQTQYLRWGHLFPN